ncbi:GntR family transcriptional regulator [Leucobacter luti]|uniref:DNA-binding GntR family transcriptional regulator n=1 Tax=Leucobacter luti TaxID=340320 RepID=A0A4R6S6B3_9MICO|nr:GntR family transcriptional regulator [Leucobacter luti]QYM75114.1 GntR family transcriptional regulator [Leucobacter luti]TDP95342.1 DNA-binding GntR family transcriptional regulator [Leucobacter luti]
MPVPTTPSKESRKTLREVAEEKIRAAIFDGTLEPGEALNDAALQGWLGVSRTPIREALNDLARVGLVEMVPQRYTRVARPRPEDRTAILQTLGALMGGVVRITVPDLTAPQRETILAALDNLMPLVQAQDALTHGQRGWELVDLFIDFCPNHILVRATRETIDSLAFQLAATRTDSSTDWESLREGYPELRAAVAHDDAVAAELAIEHVFRLSAPTR